MTAQDAAASRGYRVIVNPHNPVSELERSALVRIFLKQTTRWPELGLIQPVDQSPNARVRRHFSEEVLGRSVTAIRNYWRQAIYSGRGVPPPELASDQAVVEFVLRHRGAIGYISTAGALREAKVVRVK